MPDELVTVGSFQFPSEADAARIHLEAEGIHAFLADAEVVNMDWLLGNAVGYIKLQVPQAQAEAAFALLQEKKSQASPPADADSEGSEAEVCLACGANLPDGQQTCSACGWSYGIGETEPLLEKLIGGQDREADAEQGESPSLMDKLRSVKRPFIWFLLFPTFLGFALLLLAFLIWLAS